MKFWRLLFRFVSEEYSKAQVAESIEKSRIAEWLWPGEPCGSIFERCPVEKSNHLAYHLFVHGPQGPK